MLIHNLYDDVEVEFTRGTSNGDGNDICIIALLQLL